MSFQDIPVNVGVPKEASYELKPQAVKGTRRRINIQPYNTVGTVTTSTVLGSFYIPARPNTLLDGQNVYLKGKVLLNAAPAAGNAQSINRNAHSLINRLSVFSSDGIMIEDLTNYNNLVHCLSDISISFADKVAMSPYLLGTGTGSETFANVDRGYVGPTAVAYGTPAATQQECTFAIPLVSSLFLLSEKLFPIGMLNSDLRLDIYFETFSKIFKATTAAYGAGADVVATGYTLSELELVCDIIELETPLMSMGTPVYIHSTQYKNYTSTLAAGTGGYQSILIPHRSLSVKSMIFSSSPSTAYAANDGIDRFVRYLPCGSTNLNLSFMVGGIRTPSKPIAHIAELYAEVQKSLHSYADNLNNGSITTAEFASYNVVPAATDYSNGYKKKGLIAYDFDQFQKKSGTILSGTNMSGINTFIEFNASNNPGTQVNLVEGLVNNAYCYFDVIFTIVDGVLNVRY